MLALEQHRDSAEARRTIPTCSRRRRHLRGRHVEPEGDAFPNAPRGKTISPPDAIGAGTITSVRWRRLSKFNEGTDLTDRGIMTSMRWLVAARADAAKRPRSLRNSAAAVRRAPHLREWRTLAFALQQARYRSNPQMLTGRRSTSR